MTDSHDKKASKTTKNDRQPAGDYEVGYGKPPVQHRFKQGHKPKRTKAAKTGRTGEDDVITKLLEMKIPVLENGKSKQMTVEEAMIHSLVQKAVRGDMKAIQAVMKARALMSKAKADRAPTEEEIREKIEQERIASEVTRKLSDGIARLLDDQAQWKRMGIFDNEKGDFVDWIDEEVLRRQHGDAVFAAQHDLEYIPYEPVGLNWKIGDPSPLAQVKGRLGNY